MKRKFTLLAAVTLLAAAAGASIAETPQPLPQGRGPAAMMKQKSGLADPDNRLRLLRENLGLSDEQLAEIRPVIIAEQAEIETLRGNSTLNRDQRRAKLEELNKGTSEKVRAQLTEEQQKKYDTIKAKITENRVKVRANKPGTPPVEFTPEKRLQRLTDHLALSKEQQEQIMPILQEEYTKLKDIPANDSYNRDQRRARLQQITGETNAGIMPLLTPEQQKMYKETRDRIIERRSKKKRGTEKQ